MDRSSPGFKAQQKVYKHEWYLKNRARMRRLQKANYLKNKERDRPKRNASLKRWRKMNPDKVHNQKQRARLQHKYKLTPQQVQEAVWAQCWMCEICNERPSGKRKTLHVDHDHKTGKFRAMLCNRCNVMLGMARESVTTLQAAIDYLKYHNPQVK